VHYTICVLLYCELLLLYYEVARETKIVVIHNRTVLKSIIHK